MNKTIFYQDKPIFGLDIGSDSLRVMQLETHGGKRRVTGYGVAPFDKKAIDDGTIVDPEAIAHATNELFRNNLIGDITTNRVALSIPATKTFTRTFMLPKVNSKDMDEAVKLEIEQYVPIAIDNLYYDVMQIGIEGDQIEALGVAIPRRIVDSYMILADIMGLEVIAVDTTTGASGRLFVEAEQSDVPSVLLDLGALASDITIYDKSLVVTGTVPGGGESFTQAIQQKLGLTRDEAHVVKTKYGLGLSKKQKEITECLTPIINEMIKEIKRMIRYYEERTGDGKKIGQIITMGGGANMPGLAEFLTNSMRLPVRTFDPWHSLDFKNLAPPNVVEKTMYVTVAGLAAINTKDIFK